MTEVCSDQLSSGRLVFAAARFSARFSFSDFCGAFFPAFFGFCAPFMAALSHARRGGAGTAASQPV